MHYSRAIIVNPPNPPSYVSNKDSMGGFGQLYPKGAPPFPPLDLAYLAAVLVERGFPTEVIEAGALDLDTPALLERLHAVPDLDHALVLVRTSLPTVDWDLALCGELRKGVRIGAVCLFGPAIPALASRVRADTTIDHAILTEADGPAADLMAGRDPAAIPGLMYRRGGAWQQTPDRPFERDLDALPFPRWNLLPIERYAIPKSSVAGHAKFLPMLSSRGCPFGCSYCPYPVGQGLKWRYRSPANVVDEMEHLVRAYGVEHILFRDPMFSAQQKRVVAICEEILRRGLKVTWKCETRIDCLDPETIAIMARAGCVGVNFGVESTDPEIQKGVHRKPILEEEFVSTVATLRAHGIATFAFFVVGLPGDTVDTILASIAFASKIGADWTQFTVATPFIGTPMYDWAVREGLVSPDSYRIVSAHEASVGNENLTPTEITRLHRFAGLLQRHLLNRHGILKNRLRTDALYRLPKACADAASQLLAVALVKAVSPYFRATIRQRPPRAPVRLEGSKPVSAARAVTAAERLNR